MRRVSTPRSERLSPLDAAFLYLERPTELLHVGSVAILDGTVPFDRFAATLGARLGALPRYRQRPVRPLLDLGAPTWEDDLGFDARHHVRRVTVPPPGGEVELHAVVDALFAKPLDPARPLWEAHLIEGLAGGRAALLSKVHHCMIDGVSGAQVLEVMTETAPPGPASAPAAADAPGSEPAAGAPQAADGDGGVLGSLRAALALASPRRALARARDAVEAAGLVATFAREPLKPLPFNGELTGARRIVWASFPLDDFLAMRGAAGCKVNDVVLAVITGALRRYLSAYGLGEGVRVRSLIPVNVRRDDEHLTLGNRVSAMFASLPVDVGDPLERLRVIAREMRALKERGQPQALELALDFAGALPAPVGPLLVRFTGRLPVVHTVCTNIPGPREARYMLGRRVLEIHPIVPLAVGIGLGFAILSYAGSLSISATADPGLVHDVDRLAEALIASGDELRAALGVGATAAAAGEPAPPARPTVGELMTRAVATLGAHDSLAAAWETMRQRRIRHLPVVDGTGRPIGLLTHRDLLAAAQSSLSFRTEEERVRLLGWARAADVMETHLSTAVPSEPAAEAGRRMVRHKIGCLPVVEEDGRLVGIVTEEDFLQWATHHMASSPS